MNKALFVTWSETWDTPLVRYPKVERFDLNYAEKQEVLARMARDLFNVEPAGRA